MLLAAVGAGMQIWVDSSTLTAQAVGGLSRASYVLPGSVPMTMRPGQYRALASVRDRHRLDRDGLEVGVGVIMADSGQLVPRPLVRLPGQWQFWADQIVGATALGVVDVSSFKATSKLSDFGTGEVVVDLPCGLDESRLRRLWSWRIWAFYNGVPVWCGVPTGIVDTGSAQATVTLTELPAT